MKQIIGFIYLIIGICVFFGLIWINENTDTRSTPEIICNMLGYDYATDYKQYTWEGNTRVECDNKVIEGGYYLRRYTEKSCISTNKWGKCIETNKTKYLLLFEGNSMSAREIRRIRR